jgi:hypothetical protein
MKHITKLKLAAGHQYADAMDKSTEWMLQFMQDSCNVDLDCVMNYLQLPDKEMSSLKQEVNSFVDVMVELENY